MNIEILTSFLMTCTLINFALLMIMFLAVVFARDFIFSIHGRWFKMPREKFDFALYLFLGLYKILVIVFCFVPWIVLEIIASC